METLLAVDQIVNSSAFRAKNHFDFVLGNYRVYVADNRAELYKALVLRSSIFYEGQDKLDLDEYDSIADHIIIEDAKTKEAVGTYRMIADVFSDKFYSQSEFYLDQFLKRKGGIIELGRACIAPDYRNGRVIDLLWRGIAAYMTLINARYLFGCSSVFLKEEDAENIIKKVKSLQHNTLDQIYPWVEYPVSNFAINTDTKIPGLLQSYLRAGAKVIASPAWDKAWNCVDFFTLLDRNDLDARYHKHYFSKPLI